MKRREYTIRKGDPGDVGWDLTNSHIDECCRLEVCEDHCISGLSKGELFYLSIVKESCERVEWRNQWDARREGGGIGRERGSGREEEGYKRFQYREH